MSKPLPYIYPFMFAITIPVLVMVIGISLTSIGTKYEGVYFPVVIETEITSIEAVEGGSLVSVRFNKTRDCKLAGISWYSGSVDGVFNRVPLDLRPQGFEPTGETRPIGVQDGGPWFIGLPPEQVINNSFSYIRHTCHTFYETTSVFYP